MRFVRVVVQNRFFPEPSQRLITLEPILGSAPGAHPPSHPHAVRVRLPKATQVCSQSALGPLLRSKLGKGCTVPGRCQCSPPPSCTRPSPHPSPFPLTRHFSALLPQKYPKAQGPPVLLPQVPSSKWSCVQEASSFFLLSLSSSK